MSRYRRSHAAQLVGFVILAALFVARWQGWLNQLEPQSRSSSRGGLASGVYEVERVVDGDTLLLRGRGRLRLQGVDCPEIEHDDQPGEALGPEATTFTLEFIRDSRHRVRIEVDGEPTDHYGRWLAFVWSGDRFLNEELVRAGLARAMLRYNYSQAKKDRLRRAQLEAQRGGRGLWASNAE
jgi:micrococcal nuclease